MILMLMAMRKNITRMMVKNNRGEEVHAFKDKIGANFPWAMGDDFNDTPFGETVYHSRRMRTSSRALWYSNTIIGNGPESKKTSEVIG